MVSKDFPTLFQAVGLLLLIPTVQTYIGGKIGKWVWCGNLMRRGGGLNVGEGITDIWWSW